MSSIETRIEPKGILNVDGERLLEKMDTLVIEGIIGDDLINELRIMLNTEAFLLQKIQQSRTISKLQKQDERGRHQHDSSTAKTNTPVKIADVTAI